MPPQTHLKIRPIEYAELPLLKDIDPPGWGEELIFQEFTFHFGQSYFYPIVAELNGSIVGCASGLLNEATGWLSNIIVRPEYRGQGIGTGLTTHLVEYLHSRGCTSQILVATEMGEPIYTRLGFTTRSTYTFLRRDRKVLGQPLSPSLLRYGYGFYKRLRRLTKGLVYPKPDSHIRRAKPEDFEVMRALDREITGERRTAFLDRFLAGGWVYQAGAHEPVTGFFWPGQEGGPIIARDSQAGLELLHFTMGNATLVVPTTNQAALDFLVGAGFQIQGTKPRMTLGPEVDWRPEGVFRRGAGYSG